MNKKLLFLLTVLMSFMLCLCVCACGNNNTDNPSNPSITEDEKDNTGDQEDEENKGDQEDEKDNTGDQEDEEDNTGDAVKNVLVVYFSRTGENYGVGDIPSGGYAGYIEKGNTEIVAEMIADVTGGTLFEIVPVVSYPDSYNEMLGVAREEQSTDARPEIKDTVENFESYDVIFLGYPIWNGNCPNIILTFMESYDFAGKTVIPFCTHAGSGLSRSESTIKSTLPSATVLGGLAIAGTTAQNDRTAARKQVESFIDRLNLR